MTSEARRTPAWAATLLAIGPALAAVLLIETVRVIGAVQGHWTTRALGTLAEVTSSGLRQLALPLLLLVGQGLALLLQARLPRARLGARALSLGLAAAQVYLVWLVAIEAAYLAREFAIQAAFGATLVLYCALSLWSTAERLLLRLRRWAGGALLVGSLAMASEHYGLLGGLYPTLHSSLAIMAFLVSHLGLSLLLTGTPSTRRRTLLFIAPPAALLLTGLLTPATARGRPYVAAYSALVRPAVVAETPAKLLRPTSPPERRDEGPVRPDAEALARFARSAGLPALPAGFSLADYDVLFVMIDAVRYDRTSLGTPTLDTTPTLRQLVGRGAYDFSRAYSPANGTYPALVSLFSMTPPSFARQEIHARHWHGRLRPEQRTAPEALGQAGFRTFWIGFNVNKVMTLRCFGLTERFERHHLELIRTRQDLDADERIADRAIQEIRDARAAGARFFGLVELASPHDDYQTHFQKMPSKTPLDRYDQEVRYADAQVRRVLTAAGLERTVIIVTSDHGEAFGEHGTRFHLSSLHDEQVHVPLVLWIPGAQGRRLDRPTSTLYVLPWLMLKGPPAAREAAEQALRTDLGPLLRETDGAVLSEFVSRQRQQATLRYPDYTVYYDLIADFISVYDAVEDPREEHDLREDRPDLVDRFTPKAQAYRRARFAGQRYFFNDPPEAPMR